MTLPSHTSRQGTAALGRILNSTAKRIVRITNDVVKLINDNIGPVAPARTCRYPLNALVAALTIRDASIRKPSAIISEKDNILLISIDNQKLHGRGFARQITPKSEPKYSIHSIVTVLLRDGSSST